MRCLWLCTQRYPEILKEFPNHLISTHNSQSSYYIQKSQALSNLGFKFNFSNISKSVDNLIHE